MKKFLLAIALMISVGSFYNAAEAQNINVNINIGRQPAWGPIGYDYVGYYYFPDIDCYYDVNMGMFYYFDRGRWVSARYLPYGYRHYDLYGLYKVVLNVRDPWRYHSTHYRDYARYRGYRNQVVIRDSRDNRYRDSRNNRVTWYSDNNHSNRPHNGNNHNNNINTRPSNNKNNDRNKDNGRPGNNGRVDNKRDNGNRKSSEVRSTSGRSDLRIVSNTSSARNNRK